MPIPAGSSDSQAAGSSRADGESGAERAAPGALGAGTSDKKQNSAVTRQARLHKTRVIYPARSGTGLVPGKAIRGACGGRRFVFQPSCRSPALLKYCSWQGWPEREGRR